MAISNSNYFPIELEYVTMEINYLEAIVSNYTHQQSPSVTSKSNKEVIIGEMICTGILFKPF